MPRFYTLVTAARRDGLAMAQAHAQYGGEPDPRAVRALLAVTTRAIVVAQAGVPCAGPHANPEAEAFALTYLWLTAQANRLVAYLMEVYGSVD